MDKELLKRWIADYQKVAGSWEFKGTIEERLAAWREEQEMSNRAMVAERFLASPGKPPSQEQLAEYIEKASEWLGVETSEVRKCFIPKKDKP